MPLDADGAAVECAAPRDAYLNARLQTGLANPLDEAIVARARRRDARASGCRKIDEIPYDFVRKRLSVVVAGRRRPASRALITQGRAREDPRDLRPRADGGDGSRPLDAARASEIAGAASTRWSGEGYRVLGVAAGRGRRQAALHGGRRDRP